MNAATLRMLPTRQGVMAVSTGVSAANMRVLAATTDITRTILRKKGAFLRLKAENTGMVPFIMQQKAAGWGPELLKRRIAAPSGSLVGRGLRRVFNK